MKLACGKALLTWQGANGEAANHRQNDALFTNQKSESIMIGQGGRDRG